MKTIGVILSRYGSSRFPGKPLADINGHPMIWWVYQRAKKVTSFDNITIATDDQRISKVCEEYNMDYIMTSNDHDTPTSRLYEVSSKLDYDFYVFIGGDEPLIEPETIESVIEVSKKSNYDCVNAMTKIETAPEVIDVTNIKIVVNTKDELLYASRSALPFPKGRLDFEYMKFVGIGAFTSKALNLYHKTPKSKLEQIEECDLIRFLDQGLPVKMVKVNNRNVSVDTPKDLEFVRNLMKKS